MPLTAKDIEISVAKYMDPRVNLIVPNASWGLGLHECDLLVISKAGYASEVEIKVSKADLLRDREKRHGHASDRIKALWFALPEAKVGLAALAGGLHRLPREIGLKQAMGMILTGRHVSAQEGKALGFVNEVAAPGDLMAVARRWAEMICACSPASIRAAKETVMAGLDEPTVEAAMQNQMSYPAVQAMTAATIRLPTIHEASRITALLPPAGRAPAGAGS